MKVTFKHFVQEKKGTECTIVYNNKVVVAFVSLFYKDTFSKAKGRKFAFVKALKKLKLNKSERTEAWAWFKDNFNYKTK